MIKFLNHIWKNYKTTIAVIIGNVVVFLLWREYIEKDVADLIMQIAGAIGIWANILMKKQ